MKDFDVTDYIDFKASRRMDRFTHLALAAARQAEADAGLDIAAEPERVGAAVATGIGGLKSFEACIQQLDARGPDRVNPFSIVQIIPNLAAGWVSMELGTKGPLLSECTACAASNMAIGDGLDAIRLGRADVMICGGTEAPVTRVGIAGFGAMRAISRRNDDPKRASRPFDAERDGFVMGEAGAMIVLEELERAQARGAKIYAELLGYGVSSDATHVSDPDPTGASPARALRMAFDDAGHRAGRGRLRQRARHLDADRRHGRDARDQARARRGEGLPDAGLLDEGRDRPLPRRGRRGRGDLHDPRARARRPPADDQPGGRRPDVRPRLHPERGARGAGRDRGLELVRLRRAQRVRRVPRAGRAERRLDGQPQLEEQRVLPAPVALGDPLAPADGPESHRGVECEARLVRGQDRRLDRPDPVLGRDRDEALQQRATDAAAAGLRGDVDGVLDDAAVAAPAARPT